jgi:hypothetical protein
MVVYTHTHTHTHTHLIHTQDLDVWTALHEIIQLVIGQGETAIEIQLS